MKTPPKIYTFQSFPTRQRWVEWVSSGIMPEDAPIIMEESPWKTPQTLLKEKLAPAYKEKTQKMMEAVLLRPKIFQEYCKISGEILTRANIQSKTHPWQRASLDGISQNNWHIVQIKSGKYAWQKAQELGRTPAFYYGEGQHILAVTGLQYLTFHFHTGKKEEKPLSFYLRRNNQYIQTLITKEEEFHRHLLTQRLNPNKEILEKVQNAILKKGPKVDYQTYQRIVPTYLTPSGMPTDKGKTLLALLTKK